MGFVSRQPNVAGCVPFAREIKRAAAGDCSKWSSTVKRRIKHVVAVIREVGPKNWSSEMMGFTRKFKGDPEKDGRWFGT
ncbi:hypothetical protein EV2_009396 [Malus domestica]